tara:strand:- start:822 stop:1295 length:474 start_codon:yes stop_codon:yes gene_type:complete
MIIDCPNCDKKFEIDKKLIPSDGRLLQCGSCNNKWFFKIENDEQEAFIEEKNISTPTIEDNINIEEETEEGLLDEDNDKTETPNNSDEELSKNVRKKNEINYFKILIVIIISFVAFLLILDTFKTQLSMIIPNIETILDNLYQSLHDLKLFVLDLIK